MRSRPRVLAVCFRASVLAFAIAEGDDIIAVSRVRVSLRAARPVIHNRVRRLARAHAVRDVVYDATLTQHVDGLFRAIPMSLRVAKERLVGRADASHQELYQRLTAAFPKLRRFVTILPTAKVGTSNPWRTVALIAAALALSAKRPTH